MKSKKRLFELIAGRFDKDGVRIGNYSIDDETYGNQSMIYFFNIEKEWGISRKEFEWFLMDNGFKVNLRYWPGQDATEVQVSYFKGHHWNE